MSAVTVQARIHPIGRVPRLFANTYARIQLQSSLLSSITIVHVCACRKVRANHVHINRIFQTRFSPVVCFVQLHMCTRHGAISYTCAKHGTMDQFLNTSHGEYVCAHSHEAHAVMKRIDAKCWCCAARMCVGKHMSANVGEDILVYTTRAFA
jgi:hypothetical protein